LSRHAAAVTAIDVDGHYLEQAFLGSAVVRSGYKVIFKQMQVDEVARLEEQYDLVWFTGDFYHQRYPFLALTSSRAR